MILRGHKPEAVRPNIVEHVLGLFTRPGKQPAVEARMEDDYDLVEAHRRLLNQTTVLQLLDTEVLERKTA